MKRTTRFAVLAAAVTALACQSCEWFGTGKGGAEDSLDAPAYCTVSFVDSVTILDASAYQEMHIDFPAEEDSSLVSQAVLAWLCEQVRDCSYPDFSGEGIDTAFTAELNGDSFAEDYVNFFARKGLERMTDDLREMAKEGYGGSFLNNLTISLAEQTHDYLTFTLGYEVYTGGAHGGYCAEGATFSRRDGSRFSWSCFDPDKRAEMVELLKHGLMGYFSSSEEQVTTDSALFDFLLLFDDPDTPENELEFGLPLPQADPWLTREGLCFIYQQYEIAPYAAGLPNVTLPVDAVKDYLSEEGRRFLNLK